MTQAVLSDGGWQAVLGRLSRDLDLAASARSHGAFQRAREVRDAATLLRLALIYGATALSLRGTAAWAEASGLARLSDVALLERLRAAGRWLERILETLLSAAAAPSRTGSAGPRVRLVDATSFKGPGAKGAVWRVHADYDLRRKRFIGFSLSDQHGAESLTRFAFEPGDIVLGDRSYARAGQLRHVIDHGGDFLVRRGITSCRLLHLDGRAFDLKSTLARIAPEQMHELRVVVPVPGAAPIAARLIIKRLDPAAAAEARERARRRAMKSGWKAKPKRLDAAEFVMLLTSLPADPFDAAAVLDLYRLRWQIEIGFKRLKSLVRLADLTAKDERLVRTCLCAKLIVALLTENLLSELLDSPPSASPTSPPFDLAPATRAA
jgi:Transposase DDE domain